MVGTGVVKRLCSLRGSWFWLPNAGYPEVGVYTPGRDSSGVSKSVLITLKRKESVKEFPPKATGLGDGEVPSASISLDMGLGAGRLSLG